MVVKSDILEDATGEEIEKAFNEHAHEFFERDYTQIPDSLQPRIKKTDSYFVFYSKVAWPMMNSVWWLDSKREDAVEKAQETVDFLRDRGYGQMWWLGEHSAPAEIHDMLEGIKFARVEWDIPVMAIDLSKVDYSMIDNKSKESGVEVHKVTSQQDLKNWLSVTQEVYEYPDHFIRVLEYIHSAAMRDAERSNIQSFVAEIDGTVSGVASLYLAGGLAGLYYVGTKKEYRGRGVGSAVTLAALQEGLRRNYEIGILGASKKGLRVYEPIGFKEYYKLILYIDDQTQPQWL